MLPFTIDQFFQLLDIYNLTNTDVVTSYNQTFVPGGAWLTPTEIQPARYMKLSAQFDF